MFARLCGLTLILTAALATAVAADEAPLKTRLWMTGEKMRLVVESESPLRYRFLRLQNPSRLALDLTVKQGDAVLARAVNSADLKKTPYLKNIRAARFDADTFRVVFDLQEDIHHQINAVLPVAEYGHRLLLDIRPLLAPDLLLTLILELNKKEPFVVVIDPGHGGEDPGAVSRNSVYEKNIVLAVSKKLRDEINNAPGMRAVMTRQDDSFIALERRVQIARRLNADAFISVHADSVLSQQASGSSVFVLSRAGASSRFAKRLARQANLSDLIGGEVFAANDKTVQKTLRELSKDGKDKASLKLAQIVAAQISKINKMHGKRVESAGFAVLKSPSIPSILVETAFISNPIEEKKLLDDDFQNKMAKALAAALLQYRRHYHIAKK